VRENAHAKMATRNFEKPPRVTWPGLMAFGAICSVTKGVNTQERTKKMGACRQPRHHRRRCACMPLPPLPPQDVGEWLQAQTECQADKNVHGMILDDWSWRKRV